MGVTGRKEVYEKRLEQRNCYNGEEYEREVQVSNCSCTVLDYEW